MRAIGHSTLWFIDSINGKRLPVPIEVKPGEELSLEWDQIRGVTKEVRRVIEGVHDEQS